MQEKNFSKSCIKMVIAGFMYIELYTEQNKINILLVLRINVRAEKINLERRKTSGWHKSISSDFIIFYLIVSRLLLIFNITTYCTYIEYYY